MNFNLWIAVFLALNSNVFAQAGGDWSESWRHSLGIGEMVNIIVVETVVIEKDEVISDEIDFFIEPGLILESVQEMIGDQLALAFAKRPSKPDQCVSWEVDPPQTDYIGGSVASGLALGCGILP